MKISYFFLHLALLFVHGPATAQMADSIRLHIDSCLSVLQQHSLYAAAVDWPRTTSQVYANAKTAKTKADTFEALKTALNATGDKHAAFYQYNDEYRPKNEALTKRYSDSIRAAWSRGPKVNATMLGQIAYVSVPYMGASTQQQIDWYANWLYDSIASLQVNQPEGWIIDLRLNGGGNIRPMLGALAIFFSDGIVSYFVDRDGHESDEAAFYDGAFFIDGIKQAETRNKSTALSNAKVAVLTGPGTASSGEIVAAVFSERPHTWLLGDSTAGLANATNGFVLNEEQTYFLLSTARIANKQKKLFPETVHPQFFIYGLESFDAVKKDAVVCKAAEWLRR